MLPQVAAQSPTDLDSPGRPRYPRCVVKRTVAAVAALLVFGAATAYAAGPTPTGATIAVSPATQGARAAVKLNVSHTFYCGSPWPSTIALKFPAAEHVPSSVAVSAVHLSAGRVKAVRVSGKTVSVSVEPARKTGMTCMVIVFDKLQLLFAKRAHLGNPKQAGAYAVAISDGGSHYTAHFRVSS
jgi:hypothetical protein